MQSPHLIHDATSLYRLIQSIDQLIAEHEGLFVYTDETQEFFSYIHERAKEASQHVSELIEKVVQTPTSELSPSRYGADLIIQKDRWRTLHTYIKPATDAHTLNLPAPLIRMATEDVTKFPGMRETSIVVLLTPALMYYQNTPLSQVPRELVFLEVPYSQGPSFFTNLTIYHELGHYVFDRLAEADGQVPGFRGLSAAMESAFGERLGPALQGRSNKAWAKGVLYAWTREVFCDLFAVRHLGPAFSWALIDILSLINLMNEETEATFDVDHPAPALRFREQLKRLENDGWWRVIQEMPSEHVSLMTRLAGKSEDDYIFEFSGTRIPEFTRTFRSIVPHIQALIEQVTPHCYQPAQDFAKRREEIEECLLHGIVPSHLLAPDCSSPIPVSFINAAYCFYLTRLPDLMSKLEGQKDAEVKHRKIWIERLEAWTMKAIEDYQLLVSSRSGGERGR